MCYNTPMKLIIDRQRLEFRRRLCRDWLCMDGLWKLTPFGFPFYLISFHYEICDSDEIY